MPTDKSNDNPGSENTDRPGDAPVRGKLIDLQGHQIAEQVLDDLLRADRRSPAYHRLVARAVGVGEPILAAIVRRLDSPHGRSAWLPLAGWRRAILRVARLSRSWCGQPQTVATATTAASERCSC